jgi:hypothetical protein
MVGAFLALFIALRIAANYGLLQSALRSVSSPHYATYLFSSYEDGRFFTVGPTIRTDGTISDGDIGNGVRFCPPHSDWVCVEGPTFKFAVPHRALKVGDHWKFSGVDYALLPSYRESIPGGPDPNSNAPLWRHRILGWDYHLYAIRMGSGDVVKIFLFSPDHGLVGYMFLAGATSKDDARNTTYWLTGESGPGSVDFDSSMANSALLSPDEVKALVQ